MLSIVAIFGLYALVQLFCNSKLQTLKSEWQKFFGIISHRFFKNTISLKMLINMLSYQHIDVSHQCRRFGAIR